MHSPPPLRWHQRFLTPAARRVASWAGLITIAACALTTEVVPTADVGSVSVTPPSTTVAVGSQIPLQAVVHDASGKPVTGTDVFWSVQNPTIASISSAGVVTGMAIGSTEVSANVYGKSGIATITVQRAPVASVVVNPPRVDVAPNGQAQFTAIAYDAAQNALSDRTITWSTSNASVATVDVGGLMIALSQGSVTITATSEGKVGVATVNVGQAAVATVTVTPAPLSMSVGQTTQLAATLKDASGNVVAGPTVAWSSTNTAVATVSAQGMVTAVAAGNATITATSEGKSGSAALTISNVAVGSVSILPQGPSIVARSNIQLKATVLDVSGTIVTDRVVTWSSSAAAVATVSPTGVVTGVTPGTVVITATSEGKSGTTLVTVTPVPVGSVALSPPTPGIRVTATLPLTATVKDTNGTIVTDRVITWTSSNAAVATVTSGGVVTGVSPGTATITAASEGKSATATVTVTKIPVGTVAVSPTSKNVLVAQTVPLTATVKDSVGNVVTDRVVTWGSSNAAVVTVSTTGVVTAVAPGTADITATSETKNGTSTITVGLVPVSSVVVQPSPATITLTATAQLAAVTKDSIGGVLTGRAVTWGTSDATTVSVSSSGLITALKLGTATITATSEGKSGTSLVTVTKIPVASVTVAPPVKAMLVTQTFSLTPTVKDSVGNVVTDRPVSWGSNNTPVATVSAAGVVTAVAPGTAIITATSETKSGTSTITVSPVPVGIVVVQPGHDSLTIGTSRQFAAVTEDSLGGVLTGRVVTWGSSDPTTANVSPTGLVTALKLGTATITATSEGKNGTSPVLVAKVPVGNLTVAPPSKALLVTQTAALTPTVKDSLGTVVTDRVVTWGSNNTAVATVSSAGVLTAVAPGTATITATSETKSGTSTVTVSLVPVSTVAVSPPNTGIRVAGTTQLTATTKDSIGGVLTGRVVTWGSSDPTVATVTSTGLLTGVAAGTATITATSEGKSGTSAITVTKIPVGSVTVAPPTKALLVTQTFGLTATVRDTVGNVVTDRVVTWGSSNTAAATVSSAGVVTAVAPGTATITATSETKSGTSTITVSNVPVGIVVVQPASAGIRVTATTQLNAVTEDSIGGVLTGRAVTWGSSDPTVATVNANGLVTGVALGTATITATSEGKSGTSSVTVTKIPVGSVTVAPPSKALLVTQTVSLTATVRDSLGTVVTDRPVSWGSSNSFVATVSSTGLVTAVAPGTATITAASESKGGTSTITVSLVPVSAVVVQPAQDTLVVNATAQLAAATLDSIGGVLTGRIVTWGSSDPTTASVSASGLVTALKAGAATITATSEGKSGTSAIVVLQAPVASVTVLPPSPDTAFIGYTTQLSAVTKDAGGGTLTGRVVTWQSDNTAAATVDATGLVTGVAAGTANISATSEGKTGSVTLISIIAPVGSVVVAPASDSVTTGGITKQLTATVRDVKGTVVTDRAITWASTQPSLASVSPSSGSTVTATGISPGSPSIVATAETKSGSSAVKVIAAVATIQIAPPTATLSVATTPTVQLAATLLDASSTVIAGRTITWASSDPTIATVSASGLVTAKAPGTASITATAVLDGVTSSVATVITVVP
jgi:uncharacterized protein YjdB